MIGRGVGCRVRNMAVRYQGLSIFLGADQAIANKHGEHSIRSRRGWGARKTQCQILLTSGECMVLASFLCHHSNVSATKPKI
jgi:hypothetical protein